MSGEFIHRHHDELRTKLYNLDEEAFPESHLKFVGVMRGTKTVIDNVSDNAIIGAWTKAKDVRLL